MESKDFYSALANLPKTFKWSISEKQVIAANGTRNLEGLTFNPVTALAYFKTKEVFGTTERETLRAGRKLGLNSDFVGHVYDATKSNYNRGNAQVVRGKIRTAIGV